MAENFYKTDEDIQQILAHPTPNDPLVQELIEINNRGKEKDIAEPIIVGLFE